MSERYVVRTDKSQFETMQSVLQAFQQASRLEIWTESAKRSYVGIGVDNQDVLKEIAEKLPGCRIDREPEPQAPEYFP